MKIAARTLPAPKQKPGVALIKTINRTRGKIIVIDQVDPAILPAVYDRLVLEDGLNTFQRPFNSKDYVPWTAKQY